MVSTVTYRSRFDLSGLNKLKELFNYINSKSAFVGVINESQEIVNEATLNHNGGMSVYRGGPYSGETVKVPPRRFVKGVTDNLSRVDKIKRAGYKAIKGNLTKETIDTGLKSMAEEAKKLQESLLKNNGEDLVGWQKHNEKRTIATKGFDKPLWTRRNTTFPISYEIGKRGK